MSRPKLNLKDIEQSQLIYTWNFVKRLYDPLPSMIDPTVKRRNGMTRMQNSLGLRDIKRRTFLLTMLLNGVATAIKDQYYCYRGHRFTSSITIIVQ